MFLMTHPTGFRTKIPVFSRPPQPITNHSHFCTDVMFLMVLTTSCVGRLSKVTLVFLDSRRDKIRLLTDSSLGLIRLTSSKKVWSGASMMLIAFTLSLGLIEEATSTIISGEVSSPSKGTTI